MEKVKYEGPLSIHFSVIDYRMTEDGIEVHVGAYAEAKKGIFDGAKYLLIDQWAKVDNLSFVITNMVGKIDWDEDHPEIAHLKQPDNDS